MKPDNNIMRLYLVTDRFKDDEATLLEKVEKALKGGITCLQLREKNLEYNDFLNEAIKLKQLCSQYNVPFIVNDNLDIAIESKADGIHVGQDDINVKEIRQKVGDDFIIGVSVHNTAEAVKAMEEGADYFGIGAVFNTTTKTDVDIISYDEIKKITSISSVPTVAIGGINKNNMQRLEGTGIDGVAVVSAILKEDDQYRASKELLSLSEKYFRI